MSQLLIGLTGAAHSGKTTVAKHLASQHGLLHYALAQPLKQMLAQGFNLTEAQIDGAQKEEALAWLGKSPRELLQTLGTEWGRGMVHGDLWLLLAEQNLHNLASYMPGAAGFVISDLRFENEATWLRQRGGVVVHIQRPNAEAVRAHSSEAGIAIHDHDLVMHNERDLPWLYHIADKVMQMAASRHSCRHRRRSAA